MTGRVLNKHKDSLAGAVYIGRGSPWDNPYHTHAREVSIAMFEMYVLPGLDLTPLLGRDLYCFCAPKPCHGDAIIRALYNGL